MRRPHLLYVLNEAAVSGAPTSARQLIRAIGARGVLVTVAVLRGGPLLPELSEDAASVEVLRGVTDRLAWRMAWRDIPGARRLDAKRTDALIERLRPDAVVCDTAVTIGFALEARRRGLPTAFICRESSERLDHFVRVHGADGLDGLCLRANSQSTRDVLARLVQIPRREIPVIYPTVDVSEVRRLAASVGETELPEPFIVNVGRVDRNKAPDRWRSLGHALKQMGADVGLVWVGGKGRRLARERREVARNRAELGDLRFLGERTNPFPIVARAQLAVITSRSETFSRFSVEAMALGVPVVAFRVGGLPEAVGPGGVLIEDGDVAGMSRAVSELLNDDGERQALGELASRQAQGFGEETLQEATRKLLAQLGVAEC